MRQDDRWTDRNGYDERPAVAWAHSLHEGSSLERTPRLRPSRLLWRTVLLASATLALAVALWPRASTANRHSDVAPRWNVELSSTSRHPVTALVFGREAGLHFVSVPGTDASGEERRRIPARLGAGDVYMMSLGWSPLQVHTSSPRGTAPMSFSARARFVTLFVEPRGTGIRTSWR